MEGLAGRRRVGAEAGSRNFEAIKISVTKAFHQHKKRPERGVRADGGWRLRAIRKDLHVGAMICEHANPRDGAPAEFG